MTLSAGSQSGRGPRSAPRFSRGFVVLAGSWLPGQALDFSHGSQPSGQAAGVLSPVTWFREGSDEGQESLRNSVGTGDYCKIQHGARVDAD